MGDQRFVPRSAYRGSGGRGLLTALALAGAMFGWACTNTGDGGKFVEPVRSADGATDAPLTADAATDGAGGSGAAGAAGAAGNAGTAGAAGNDGIAGAAGIGGAGGI